jgi:N-acylneuraminate cytidylyltransferase
LKIITIIPARGGSKGVPGKNIKLLNGKPLISYSIESSIECKLIDDTYVTTDCNHIKQISEDYGARVIIRPPEISGDTASSESALIHALDYIDDKKNIDLIVFLQCTSPFREIKELENAIKIILKENSDSLFSGFVSHKFFWRKVNNKLESINYDYKNRPRRQDRGVEFIENGSIYIFKPNILLDFKNRLGGKISVYEMSESNSLEIDSHDDFILAEKLMKLRNKKEIENIDFSLIKILFLDFDGVMTDNKVITFDDGKEAVLSDRGDGFGIEQLLAINLEIIVISKERNKVVAARCKKLKIDYYQSVDKKWTLLKSILNKKKISSSNCGFVGNDLNDIECLQKVKYSFAPSDAVEEVKNLVKYQLKNKGGNGAIRELANQILKSKTYNLKKQ